MTRRLGVGRLLLIIGHFVPPITACTRHIIVIIMRIGAHPGGILPEGLELLEGL